MPACESWVVDGISQFLRSPLWTTPVHEFIDDNCILFSGAASTDVGGVAGEQSVDHKVVHDKFRSLIDGLLTNYIEELGVPLEDVLEGCEVSDHPDGAKFLEYVYSLDKYETFVFLMAKRNAELEREALKQLEKIALKTTSTNSAGSTEAAPPAAAAPSGDGDVDEDEEVRLAIQASLADADAATRRAAELEDEELQRALQLSLAMEEQRAEREQQAAKEAAEADGAKQAAAAEKAREELRRNQEAEQLAATQRAAQEAAIAEAAAAAEAERKAAEAKKLDDLKRESDLRKAQLQETVLEARVQVAARSVEETSGKNSEETKQAAEPPASVSTGPTSGGGAPIGSAPKKNLPGLSGVQFGRQSGGFGAAFKPLPGIGGGSAPQPTHDELKAHVSAGKEKDAPTKAALDEEAIKRREQEMRRQRDLIRQRQKAERQAELHNYSQAQPGAAPSAAPAAPAQAGETAAEADARRELTRQLARRFRTDIEKTAGS